MKRYTSTLESVLRVRKVQEDAARAELQKASSATAAARAAEAKAWAHYQELSASDDLSLLVQRQLGGFAAEAVADAGKEVEAKKADTASATEAYLDAAKAVSAVERLEERRREEHTLDLLREEAALVDEFVTTRYARQQQSRRKQDRER